jgi:hypothetical protein
LGFVDEDGQPAALFLRCFRKIPDQLAEVGLELPGIAAPPFRGDLEPEGPRAGYVDLDAECLDGGQCLREFVTSAWPDQFTHRRVQGAGQGVSQRARGISFDDDRHPVAFLGQGVKLPQQGGPPFTTQAMQDN